MSLHIVTGPCQSRKTWTTLNLVNKLTSEDTNCFFITQANNTAIVNQVITRCQSDAGMKSSYASFEFISKHKYDASQVPKAPSIFAGYWHERTRHNVIDILTTKSFPHIIIVIDEVEQGGLQGVYERLQFLCEVLDKVVNVSIILITATIANLSACISKLVERGVDDNLNMQYLLTSSWQVHQVNIHEDYVGLQWYIENDLVRTVSLSKDHQERIPEAINIIRDTTAAQRRLALICISARQEDHTNISHQLLNHELFNVSLELNSADSKSFRVHYYSEQHREIRVWNLPIARITNQMKAGGLMAPPLPFILQAALFLGTALHDTIKSKVEETSDWMILQAVSKLVSRPIDWPSEPYVAVVAGHMASRGMTLSSAQAYFMYRMYFYIDSPSSTQRGAPNTQRIGRSYGNIMKLNAEIRPIIIATQSCIRDALANEILSSDVHDDVVDLQELVSPESWESAVQRASGKLGIEKRKAKNKTKCIDSPLHTLKPIKTSITLPSNFVVATDYSEMSFTEFVDNFIKENKRRSVTSTSRPKTFSACLKDKIDANFSFADSSADKVANIRNYYLRPEWAGKEYHIIILDDTKNVRVIKRNKTILDAPTLPLYIGAHSVDGRIVVYRCDDP